MVCGSRTAVTLISHTIRTCAEHCDGAYTADIADINGDGFPDVVVGAYQASEFCVWFSDSENDWHKEVVTEQYQGPCGCDAADVNGDGTIDLLLAAYGSGKIVLFLNEGGSYPEWTESVISISFDGAHDVEASDIDLDGDIDILAAAAERDRVVWWRNDGGNPIQWHQQIIADNISYPCRIQAADLDGDGNTDVIASLWEGSAVLAWYGSGGQNPIWTEQEVYDPVYGAHSVRAQDIDKDGDMDLIVSGMSLGRLILFRNCGGNPVSWEREIIDSFPGCAYARSGDMDGDGDFDILTCSFSGAGGRWYENDGSGTLWTLHETVAEIGSISCALPADMDADGDLDGLFTAYAQDRVVWSELTEFRTDGSLTSSILDISENPQWASVDWDVLLPYGAEFSMSYRTSDDPVNMGEWSEALFSPCTLSGLLDRYFQYRISMTTAMQNESPVVRSIEVNWDPSGMPEDAGCSLLLELPGGNPVWGPFTVLFSDEARGECRLEVFNCAGRVVWSREFFHNCGETENHIPSLPAGVYKAVLTETGTRAGSLTFVVL